MRNTGRMETLEMVIAQMYDQLRARSAPLYIYFPTLSLRIDTCHHPRVEENN